jgi:hypothetical protein
VPRGSHAGGPSLSLGTRGLAGLGRACGHPGMPEVSRMLASVRLAEPTHAC